MKSNEDKRDYQYRYERLGEKKRLRRPPDPHVEKAKDEVAEELGVTRRQVNAVINHFIDWQIASFINAEYACYHWEGFGTFTFFNRKDGKKYFPAVDEYYNKTRLKDKNRRDLELQKEEDKQSDIADKKEVIGDIKQFHPSECPYEFKTYAWYIGGEQDEGEWNEKTMINEPLERLEECLNILANGGKKKADQNED